MKRRNIFKPNNDDVFLPSLSNGKRVDGSGRGVQMDAPIVRSWKNASGYTRGSYMWLLGSLACVFFSYKYIMYHYGTYVLHVLFLYIVTCFPYLECLLLMRNIDVICFILNQSYSIIYITCALQPQHS